MNFDETLEKLKIEDDVLGVIMVGSRGKGFENEHSDYDLFVVVKDGTEEEQAKKFKDEDKLDITVMSLSAFKESAAWGTNDAWQRYDFTHTKLLFDRTRELPEIIKTKGYVPEGKLNDYINRSIGSYINGVYRTAKCIRTNNNLGARLESVNSILDLLTLIFAINGRHRPFLSYVEKELEVYPLEKSPFPPTELIEKINAILNSPNLEAMQEMLEAVEKLCREIGKGNMFDWWKGREAWTLIHKAQ